MCNTVTVVHRTLRAVAVTTFVAALAVLVWWLTGTYWQHFVCEDESRCDSTHILLGRLVITPVVVLVGLWILDRATTDHER